MVGSDSRHRDAKPERKHDRSCTMPDRQLREASALLHHAQILIARTRQLLLRARARYEPSGRDPDAGPTGG
jgi:hypothetical protein